MCRTLVCIYPRMVALLATPKGLLWIKCFIKRTRGIRLRPSTICSLQCNLARVKINISIDAFSIFFLYSVIDSLYNYLLLLKTAHINQNFRNMWLKNLVSEKKLQFIADLGLGIVIFLGLNNKMFAQFNHNFNKITTFHKIFGSVFTQTCTDTYAQFTLADLTKEFDDSDFLVQQVYQTLQNLDSGKVPDIDGFSNTSKLASVLAEPLTYLFNPCLLSAKHASAWKKAIIIQEWFKVHFKNYRPISNTSIFFPYNGKSSGEQNPDTF